MATIQHQMKATLEKAGLPFKRIEVYGSQIVVTTVARDSANRWAQLLAQFSKVRGITESLDEKHDATHGTPPSLKYTRVHRVFAAITSTEIQVAPVVSEGRVATGHESAPTRAHTSSAAGVSSHLVQS